MSLRSNFYGKRKYILLALARAVPQRCSDSFSHSFSIIRSESYCCLPQKMVGDLQIGLFLGLSIGIGIGMGLGMGMGTGIEMEMRMGLECE